MEAVDGPRRNELGPQEFERHELLEAEVGAAREIDLTHAAAAQEPDDVVVADRAAGGELGGDPRQIAQLFELAFQLESRARAIDPKHLREIAAEVGVRGRDLGEPLVTLGLLEVEKLVEDGEEATQGVGFHGVLGAVEAAGRPGANETLPADRR